jgi:aminoglycoside N3'-acetyltransferase
MQSKLREIARSLLGDNIRRKWELKKLGIQKKIYRNPISVEQFRQSLKDLGEWKSRVVFVQSSWNQFYNLDMSAIEVIYLMQDLAGERGTLAMPAYPLINDPSEVLHIDTAPSSTGMLTEIFRRMPGIERSIHLTSSVVALGPLAKELVSDHHTTPYSWGRQTPFGKCVEQDALLVTLGFVKMGFTALHFVECELHGNDARFDRIFGDPVTYSWVRKNGLKGSHSFLSRKGRLQTHRIAKGFDDSLYKKSLLSNMRMESLNAKAGIARAIDLAKNGLTIYPDL